MTIVIGNSRYGVHLTTFRWGCALHWEWKGETYGGSWALESGRVRRERDWLRAALRRAHEQLDIGHDHSAQTADDKDHELSRERG